VANVGAHARPEREEPRAVSAPRPSAFSRFRGFLGGRLWEARLSELSAPRAALYWGARVLTVTVRGFLDDRLSFRAAALTYFTVLSIVPFLAFAFAVLKGFGVYASFVEGTIQPYVDETFAANEALYDAIGHILRFVEQTDVSRLGTLGVVVLAYAAVTLVSNVEVALNDIFGAKTRRPLLRQITDYVTLLVVGPLLLLAATTVSAAAQSSSALRFLRETLGLGPLIDFALGFGSVALLAVALFAMYAILPNVRVRPLAALVGALLGALLWQGSLVLHVQLQMGVARYSALYSVLGALPIFLVWTYVSWLVVLVGACVAAAHQADAAVRQPGNAARVDPALEEALALAIAAEVARSFVAGGPRVGAAAIAERLRLPPPVVDAVVEALVRAGLLARVVSGREAGLVPGRDPERIRAEDLRDALRREPRVERLRAGLEGRLAPGLRRIVRAAEEERRRSPNNVTLRALAAADVADEDDDAPGPEREGRAGDGEEGDDRAPAVDEKQPDVPA
jgi:membrane protein